MENITIFTGLLITIVFVSPIHSLPSNNTTLPLFNQSEISSILINDCIQDIACAINILNQSLLKLPYQELQPCPTAGHFCGPNNSNDAIEQISRVQVYAEYILTEDLINNYTYPNQLLNLFNVINTTLPILQKNETHDVNMTLNFQPIIPVCDSDISFQSNCSVHILSRSIEHLMALHTAQLPACSFCTCLGNETQREINEVHLFFSGDYLDEILPLNFQCRMLFYFAQYELQLQQCQNDTYGLHNRLIDLTLWMNETLPLLNQSLPEMDILVETLSTNILPSTEISLDGLKLQDSCEGIVRFNCTELTREQVERVTNLFAIEECFPEPDQELAMIVQLFDLLRKTFNSFFEHLSIEGILLV